MAEGGVMTSAERAAALLMAIREVDQRHADEGVAFVTELLDPILEHDAQTRRAALEEAAAMVRRMAGASTREAVSGCGNTDDEAEAEANDTLRFTANALDRLAREGVGG